MRVMWCCDGRTGAVRCAWNSNDHPNSLARGFPKLPPLYYLKRFKRLSLLKSRTTSGITAT